MSPPEFKLEYNSGGANIYSFLTVIFLGDLMLILSFYKFIMLFCLISFGLFEPLIKDSLLNPNSYSPFIGAADILLSQFLVYELLYGRARFLDETFLTFGD